MAFCQWAEMGPKVGFWVQKRVKSGSKPTFDPLHAHSGIFAKTHFSASLGGWKLFSKKGPMKQSRPSIRLQWKGYSDDISGNEYCNECGAYGSEDLWAVLPCLSDRSVFIPFDTCTESSATAGKIICLSFTPASKGVSAHSFSSWHLGCQGSSNTGSNKSEEAQSSIVSW